MEAPFRNGSSADGSRPRDSEILCETGFQTPSCEIATFISKFEESMPAHLLQTRTESEASTYGRDVLASVVVFLVALPLCMGIAIASGVPASAGLLSGIVGGIVVGLLTGCPLQVSGPAAGLATVIFDAVRQHGLEQLGLIVFVAGLMQLLAALLGLGQWFRAVSPAVIKGMLAGIGILIFSSQFHVMLDDVPKGSGLQDLLTLPQAVQKAAIVPHVPEAGSRQDLRSLVQDLGELHRRQINLNEHVAERVPRHRDHVPGLNETILNEFRSEQLSIREDLQQVLSRAQALYARQPERLQRISSLGKAALQQQDLCLDDLEQDQWSFIAQAQGEAAGALAQLQGGFKNHEFAAGVGILTILVLLGWKALPWRRLRFVPAPLIAIIAATSVAAYWQLPILYVEAPTSLLEELHILWPSVLWDVEWGGILKTAAIVATLASAQTLLTATALDQLHHGERTRYNKELMAQGIGNCLCGIIGGLPLAGVIVRSTANLEAGGKTRLSTILHGAWMLIFIVALSTLLRTIPTAALAAILVYTGYKLVDWKAFGEFRTYGWGELAVYLTTIVMVVAVDLLAGVVTGFALALARLACRVSRLKIDVEPRKQGDMIRIRLEGAATFLRLPKLAQALEQIPRGRTVELNIAGLSDIDQASYELLRVWEQQYSSENGSVSVDWKSLERWAHLGRHPDADPHGPPVSIAS